MRASPRTQSPTQPRPRFLPFPLLSAAALALLAIASPSASYAALGQREASIDAEQVQMKASRRLISRGAYQLHELSQPSGVVVREFVDASGLVFAVAWSGPFKPDLGVLLGEHFQTFVRAGQSPHANHRVLTVQTADVVIQSEGKMRAFTGRAYLPSRIPAGVQLEDIQ